MGEWADLGYNYAYGLGCEQSFDKALEYFRQGAEENDAAACWGVVELYDSCLPKDEEAREEALKEAFQMCVRAALLGHGKAALALSRPDFAEDKTLYARAYCHEKGYYPESDIQKAILLYEQDAEKDGYHSMMRLYDIYENGLAGLPADKEKAAKYLFMSGYGRD